MSGRIATQIDPVESRALSVMVITMEGAARRIVLEGRPVELGQQGGHMAKRDLMKRNGKICTMFLFRNTQHLR